MIKYHFRPEKKLSQYFCINEALLQFLANSAEIEKNDVIVEIGPGLGFLTERLVAKAKKAGAKVIAIDADEKMIEVLSEEYKDDIDFGVLQLIHSNALKEDYDALGATKIVSLPPYHISSDLTTQIAQCKGVKKAILVLDKGFVQKLLAFEGLSEYVALTAFANLNSKVSVLEDGISSQSFFPAPNCLSVVIELGFHVKENSKEYFTFLRELFRHKNKDLSRGLKQAYGFLSTELGWKEKEFEKNLQKLGEKSTKKVYLLSPQELLEVYKMFSKP